MNMKNITYETCLLIKDELIKQPKYRVQKKYKITRVQCNAIIEGRFDIFGLINKNTTVIRQIPLDELIAIIKSSYSYSDAIRKCNLDVRSSYIKMLRKIVETYNVDISHFAKDNSSFFRKNPINNEEILNMTNISHTTVKKRVIQYKLIPYECAICGNTGTHMSKTLVLQLDHVNGNNKDNRIENLRFLCPNCHSQTENFTGKNQKHKIYTCIDCGAKILRKSIRCTKCSNTFKSELKFEVSKEDLESLIKEKPMTEIGKQFGVSDNAIKKRCKKLGIELKDMRGYWSKLRAGKI